MTSTLEDCCALVVGASSGIGRATALLLAEHGARVVAAARRLPMLEQIEPRLPGGGVLACDVADRSQAQNLVAAAWDRLGRIDLLVYAAGTNIPERAMRVLTPETWDMMLAVNLTGAFLCTHAVLPRMRARGGGLIIYISTFAVHQADLSGASYQASKHGLSGLAHATRAEEKGNGIRTSVILPGLCRTDLIHKRPAPTPPEVLAHALEPEDVAETVLMLARLHPRAVVPELHLLPSRL